MVSFTGYRSTYELTKDTPYLACMDELWSILWAFQGKWSCYEEGLLYHGLLCLGRGWSRLLNMKLFSVPLHLVINTLRLRQNGRHLPDYIFRCIFLNENVSIFIKISLNFVPKGPISNILALVQIMAWCRPGDKPLSEPMMVSLLMHICVTRPQWVILKAIWGQLVTNDLVTV